MSIPPAKGNTVATPFNWICPFCQRPQTVVEENFSDRHMSIEPKSALGPVRARVMVVACANPDCRELWLEFSLHRPSSTPGYITLGARVEGWLLRPESSARPRPQPVPEHIYQNYLEACRIRDLSPNASATMSRRCLQGMIRNFCGISKGTLHAEINELRKQVDEGSAPRGVDPGTVDAIDDLRKIGNIGAHMEANINLILDVDPGEAQALIELNEMLFDEWYVARAVREERLARVAAIVEEKKTLKNQGKQEAEASPEAAAEATTSDAGKQRADG